MNTSVTQDPPKSDYQIASQILLQSILDNKTEVENRMTLGPTIPIQLFQMLRMVALGVGMENLIGPGASAMVYQSGVNFGRILGTAVNPSKDKGLDTYVGEIGLLCKQLSIGIVVPTKVDVDSGEINFRVDECVSCAGIHSVNSPICHFEAGMVGGIVGEFVGQNVKATETKCNAIGDKTCAIETKFI
ncbi:MAG: V4R domain-containing protein [Methylococcaceae bacterium]